MRKLASLAALALALTTVPRPAEARGRCSSTCELVIMPFAAAIGLGVVGLYGYGTVYFIAGDLKDEPKPIDYHGTELMIHGSLATLFTQATVSSYREGNIGSTIGAGAFATLHLTLATNGLRGTWRERDQIGKPSSAAIKWGLGTVYGINTLAWASGWPNRHGRGYGIAEVSINAPIAIGLGLMAHEQFTDKRGGAGVLYGGMAALSTLYVVHGVKTVIGPKRHKLDLLGTDLAPTVVSDGFHLAPGLGTAGSF